MKVYIIHQYPIFKTQELAAKYCEENKEFDEYLRFFGKDKIEGLDVLESLEEE